MAYECDLADGLALVRLQAVYWARKGQHTECRFAAMSRPDPDLPVGPEHHSAALRTTQVRAPINEPEGGDSMRIRIAALVCSATITRVHKRS